MSAEFQYDVFLSHNAADKPRVRKLAEQLKRAGLRVWFDEWVIQPGDDIYLAIERGLETSRALVLCLSPAALGSDWVGLERSTVLFRDPANKDRRFVPLLLADCKLPDTLRRYRYLDFRTESDAVFNQLVNVCQSLAKPKSRRKLASDVRTGSRQNQTPTPKSSSPFQLAGHWTATARQERGEPYEVYLTFKTFDNLVLGSVSYPAGNGAVVEGKIEGDTLSFTTRHVPNFSSQEVTIHWHAKIVGEVLHGLIQDADGVAEFTAKRTAEPRRYGWRGK